MKDGDKRVFDDLAMYAYLLTSKTDNSDLFYHVKQIIQFNISIQWMTAQTKSAREGSVVPTIGSRVRLKDVPPQQRSKVCATSTEQKERV